MQNSKFPPSLSYWEVNHYFRCTDICIVGSGIVGLTSAIFCKHKNPKLNILVLEKGFLPSGASTKNAGFACFGSVSEILADLTKMSETEVSSLVKLRVEGLNLLRGLLGDSTIDYQTCGGYEIFSPEQENLFELCRDKMEYANSLVSEATGLKNTYSIKNSSRETFGFRGVDHFIFNQHEGAIDTGKMMAALIKLAREMEITILNGLEVTDLEQGDNCVALTLNQEIQIETKHVHVANNGFAGKLLSKFDVKPARAQVLITSEIANLKVKGTFHMDEGYYYFRNVGNRILLGGGRNLEVEKETTTELDLTDTIQDRLDHVLRNIILPNEAFEIEHRWAGVMGIGAKKTAIVETISPNVTCAIRLGGMGVAIGSKIGKQSSEIIE